MTYQIVIRSQHAKRGRSGNRGPDKYMALVAIPTESPLVGGHPLSPANKRKYGWEVLAYREFYGQSMGPRSKYAVGLRELEQMAKRLAGGESNPMLTRPRKVKISHTASVKRKVRVGPKGGRYYLRRGRKVYV